MKSRTTQPDTGPHANVPDFSCGITRENWADRAVGGRPDRYFASDMLLRAATGLIGRNAGVTAQTLQTSQPFPTRRPVGEDVIWTGYVDGSFLPSHRLPSVMTRTGDGILGQASGTVAFAEIDWAASRPDGRQSLAGFAGPVLLVSGTKDRLCTPAMQRDMVRAQPRAQWLELPRVGHFVPLEAPARLSAALRLWLGHEPAMGVAAA